MAWRGAGHPEAVGSLLGDVQMLLGHEPGLPALGVPA